MDKGLNVVDEMELVKRMRAGDRQSFDDFFNAHATRLASFASRRCALDAAALEDVVQQTMIKAIKNLNGFRGESTLFTWLCQICRNLLADVRRKAARQPILESLDGMVASQRSTMPVQLIDYRDPLDTCSADAMQSVIRRAVNDLPARYGRILELKYGDELSIAEIASAMGLSESAAQSLLARARRAFGEIWLARGNGTDFESFASGEAGSP